MANEKKTFSTRDLTLATTLISLQFFLEKVDYQVEGERQRLVGYFNFEDTQELQEVMKQYWQRKLAIEPQQFMLNLRNLKAQVEGVYKNPHTEVSGKGVDKKG